MTRLFTKKFLAELQSKEQTEYTIDAYMLLGFSFHDAIVKIAESHNMKPEYHQGKDHERNS